MSLFVVDPEKCKKDHICVDECPAKIIKMIDKDTPPVPVSRAEEFCIQCGHCVAVCPYGALSHKAMAPEQCPPVRKELLPNPEWAEHFLRSRRSIRTYKKKVVERETITRLIDIARYGPSGSNSQPVRWLVIHDNEEVKNLAAPSMGLGACWAGYFNAAASLWPPMQEALGLPEDHTAFGSMMIGYPKYAYYRLPLRNEPHITWR